MSKMLFGGKVKQGIPNLVENNTEITSKDRLPKLANLAPTIFTSIHDKYDVWAIRKVYG